jgi:NAD(P)-binding Rossmann-like domain
VHEIETDYLVIGAGAAGMAFVDALITACDADVVMVDRRHRPGGHWNDAYPFVRLHQPSALYGVNSRRLGSDQLEQTGPNADYYPRATAVEICDYYQRVLDEQLLPSDRVRFFGMSEWPNEHRLVSRLTGTETPVRVRRRVVDARYLEPSIPATHVPSFTAEPGVRLIPVNDLVRQDLPASGFTVIGGGKTAMDACLWLLDAGVPPEVIRWVRPRDAWLLNRAFQQPLDRLPQLIEGVSLDLEAAAQADDIPDLFGRLEACGQLIRLDPEVEPTMYRCATVSEAELVRLRSIESVVRLGRVTHIGPDQITLAGGSIPADPGQVHVDCSAPGLRTGTGRAGIRRRPDHAAAGPGLPAGLQRRPGRIPGGGPRRRCHQAPALPREPVSGPGPGLDPGHLHRPTRRDGLDGRPGPVLLDAAISAQWRGRDQRPPGRPANAVGADPPVG